MLRKKISFLSSGCTVNWYITVFQQRPQSDWKQRQSFIPLQSREKKGNCSKVKMKLRRHSSPRVHDGNCWQKKSYCHSERSLYKNLVSSSLEESVHLICHWWSKLALSVTTIYQHWTWEPQVRKMADQITKERVCLLVQIRPSPSCASLSCVPKALRVRGALKAAQRRWRSKHHIAGARAPRVAEKSRTSSRHSYLLSRLSRYPSCWPPQITITSGWSRYPTITSSITILHHQLQ